MADPDVPGDLAELIRRAAAGDRDARARLLESVYPRVRARVHRELELDFRRNHRWILPLFSTGDIVQDVFVGVLTALEGFQGDDDAALVRYLTTLVRNRLVDAVRYHEAERRDPQRKQPIGATDDGGAALPAGDDPTPSMAAALAEQMETFRAVLDTFPEQTRLLLERRLCDGAPFEELASELGWATPNAAGKAFRAAKARLLIRLQERGIAPPGGGDA
ncbi:MAG: sigma-70 family RNA polymerase sigma factor [Planctomycetes bacterium]|nr:sigma-70 family RNA polymerase sigma factor [Planctomycetota bacterium]